MPLVVWGANVLYPTGYNQIHTSFEVIYMKILQERMKKCLPHVKKDSRPEEIAASSVLEEWMTMNNKISVDLEFDLKEKFRDFRRITYNSDYYKS